MIRIVVTFPHVKFSIRRKWNNPTRRKTSLAFSPPGTSTRPYIFVIWSNQNHRHSRWPLNIKDSLSIIGFLWVKGVWYKSVVRIEQSWLIRPGSGGPSVDSFPQGSFDLYCSSLYLTIFIYTVRGGIDLNDSRKGDRSGLCPGVHVCGGLVLSNFQ